MTLSDRCACVRACTNEKRGSRALSVFLLTRAALSIIDDVENKPLTSLVVVFICSWMVDNSLRIVSSFILMGVSV